ncbi:SAVED domain-containing protein [Candidatus Poriferisodalis sp.]|uniref:SAVED domain-containing protein n=1 Tax=Candidatus Poriferisodalis sp. TaxID=3101277 RepID=UPI003C6FEFBE
MDSPVAMVSYSWRDDVAAELIHDELALRGFRVIHDRHSFTHGSRIPANMASAVDACDVFVAYLTPSSLYLDRPDDQPRPALVGELRPALRQRRENLRPGAVDTPVILALAHGLGDRNAAAEIIRRQTGEDIASLWITPLDQATPHITHHEAALVANSALRALTDRQPPAVPIDLFVATRGTKPPPRRLTIDGTRLLGGDRNPNRTTSWARFLGALHGVAAVLAPTITDHRITVDLRCHLSAAFATGRVFHQATRWLPAFTTRHGPIRPADTDLGSHLKGDFDHYNESGDLIVDIDLLGHDVADLTSQLAASLPRVGGRISLSRRVSGVDLSPAEIASSARWAANLIRKAHAALRPATIHLTQATPAAFAALLGHHLTALGANVTCYELDGARYTAALTIPHAAP